MHLVAPSLVAGFEGRRVKNDQRDCKLLGDLLRANMLPEACIAPPKVREWRGLGRYLCSLSQAHPRGECFLAGKLPYVIFVWPVSLHDERRGVVPDGRLPSAKMSNC